MKNLIIAATVTAALLGACALTAAPALAQAGSPHAPFMHGAGGGKPGAKDPAVDKLVAEAQKLDKQLKAKPKDAKLKQKAADAWYKAGYAQEYSKVNLLAKDRYRVALKYYRTALALNPGHKDAAKELKQIEDIYRTMPGGIPK